MAGWHEKYVGRPYIPEKYDCGTLVKEVLRDEFGKDVVYTEDRLDGPRGLHRQLEQHRELNRRIDQPSEGCMVLMRYGRKGSLDHVGVYLQLGGIEYVLHNFFRTGVVLTKLSDLHRFSLAVEDFYDVIQEASPV